MRPAASAVVHVRDFELRFDLPVGKGERGVANVAPRPNSEVWGVVYAIDQSERERLDRSEGVGRGFYQPTSVEARDLADGRFDAWTYVSDRGVTGRKPSRRYLGLLLAGARYHGLPTHYVATLRALDLARDERLRQLDWLDPSN